MLPTLATTIATLALLAAALPQPEGHRISKAIPITKQFSLANADNSVNFDALRSHVASVKAKVLRGLDTFEQNTGTAHPSVLPVKSKTRKRGAGDPLINHSMVWYGNISIGTPPRPFTVNFDTGSSDLFLPGSTCGKSCAGHTLWDPSSSSTARSLHRNFVLNYGTGNITGAQYTDTVSIAGFTATNQTLGAATMYSPGFRSSQFPPDGLMGLGFPSLSDYGASPVFDTLVSEGQVDPTFSFELSSSGGELYIGGSNPSLYSGHFAYTPVTIEGYWQVNMDNILGNDKRILNNLSAIVDTGTTLVVGPLSDVSNLHKALGGKPAPTNTGPGTYTFKCDAMPNISFTFGGESFPISSSALNIGQVEPGSSECVSGIIGMEISTSLWIVGNVFLQGVYTTFDAGNARVGFAHLA